MNKGKSLANAIYGYCPVCGEPGQARERRLDGNDVCRRGHKYPSKDALVSALGFVPPKPRLVKSHA